MVHDVDVRPPAPSSPGTGGRVRWRSRTRRRSGVRRRRGRAGGAAGEERDARVTRTGAGNREWLYDVLQSAWTKIAPASDACHFAGGVGVVAELAVAGQVLSGWWGTASTAASEHK